MTDYSHPMSIVGMNTGFGLSALEHHSGLTAPGGAVEETHLVDLLANLMHVADDEAIGGSWSFDEALRIATDHYTAEKQEVAAGGYIVIYEGVLPGSGERVRAWFNDEFYSPDLHVWHEYGSDGAERAYDEAFNEALMYVLCPSMEKALDPSNIGSSGFLRGAKLCSAEMGRQTENICVYEGLLRRFREGDGTRSMEVMSEVAKGFGATDMMEKERKERSHE